MTIAQCFRFMFWKSHLSLGDFIRSRSCKRLWKCKKTAARAPACEAYTSYITMQQAPTSGVESEYLREINFYCIEHSPYSPDLAPCDFLFLKLKDMLKCRHYNARTSIDWSAYQCLKRMSSSDYHDAFLKWIQCCKKCFSTQGEYFERQSEP